MDATGRGRGRPPAADVDELRVGAIDILLRDGYRDATMGGIASELGVSLRTLHRYFPTKADIVWGGLEGAIDALRRGFARADPHVSLGEAIMQAVVSAFEEDADELEVSRARFRAIATTPELQSVRAEVFRSWRAETTAFAARRLGLAEDDLVARTAGSAVQAAIAEALLWWATHPDEATPAEAAARAIGALRVFGPR